MLHINEVFTTCAEFLTGGSHSVLTSPFITAVIIALIVLFIFITSIVPEVEYVYENTTSINIGARVVIWSFAAGFILAWLRNAALQNMYRENTRSSEYKQLLQQIQQKDNLQGIQL